MEVRVVVSTRPSPCVSRMFMGVCVCVCVIAGSFLVAVGKASYDVNISSERVFCNCTTFGGGDICRHIFACVRTILTEHSVQTEKGPMITVTIQRLVRVMLVNALRCSKWLLTREAFPITREAVPLPSDAGAVDTSSKDRAAKRRK